MLKNVVLIQIVISFILVIAPGCGAPVSQGNGNEKQVQELKRDLDEKQKELSAALNDYQSANARIANLESQLKAAKNEQFQASKKQREAQERIEKLIAAASSRTNKNDEIVRELNTQVSSAQEKNVLAKEKISSLEKALDEAQKKIASDGDTIKSIMEKLALASESTNKELEKAKAESSKAQLDADVLKKIKTDLEKTVTDLQQKVDERNNEIAKIKREILQEIREKERLAREVERTNLEKEKMQNSLFVSQVINGNKLSSYEIGSALGSKHISPEDEQKIIDVLAKNTNKNETINVLANIALTRPDIITKIKPRLIDSLVNIGGIDNPKDAEMLLQDSILPQALAKLSAGRGDGYSLFDDYILPTEYDKKALYTQIKYSSKDDTTFLLDRIKVKDYFDEDTLELLEFLITKTKNPPDEAAKSLALYSLLKTDALKNDPVLTKKALVLLMENGEFFLADKTNAEFILDIYNKIKTDDNSKTVLEVCIASAFYYLKSFTNKSETEEEQEDLPLYQKAIKELLTAIPEAKEVLFNVAIDDGNQEILRKNQDALGLTKEDFR